MTDGIVLVHGGGATAKRWDPLLPHLATPAAAVDLPGRGGRPGDVGKVTIEDAVAAVIEDADAAGFERFCLVGHSLGGVTITETAFRHPDRVAALVYVAALAPPVGSTAAILTTGTALDPPGGVLPPRPELQTKEAFGHDMTDEEWAEHAATRVDEAAGLMNAVISGYPTGIPITYVACSLDVPVNPELVERMLANLGPEVTVHTLECSHSVMSVKPKELAAILDEAATAVLG